MSDFDENWKEARFDQYCPRCKHKDVNPAENSGSDTKDLIDTPCDDCLEESAHLYSHKPAKFEEA